jgi:hypothetical protein
MILRPFAAPEESGFYSGSVSDLSDEGSDFPAGLLSGLNASPASRSIGIPDARQLKCIEEPLDSPLLNSCIEPPSSLLRRSTRSGGLTP